MGLSKVTGPFPTASRGQSGFYTAGGSPRRADRPCDWRGRGGTRGQRDLAIPQQEVSVPVPSSGSEIQVLVIGGTGFIDQALVRLRQDGQHRILTRNPSGFPRTAQPPGRTYKGDFTDPQAVESAP